MQCQAGIGIILRGGAQNYSGVWLIAPIPDPNLIPIQDPCHISNLGDNIRGSYRSTILRTQLPSDRTWKMGPSIFAAISWIKFAITTRASFPNMPLKKEQTENFVSLACENSYNSSTSFLFTTDPGESLLHPCCMIHSLGPPVWRQYFKSNYFQSAKRGVILFLH